MNPYDILGVSKDATDEQIRHAYKILAQQHHPDKGGSEDLFKQIKWAYEILSDPYRRKEYDQTGQYVNRPSIRDEVLDQLSRLFLDVVARFNYEQEDLILIMKSETRALKELVQKDINACSSFIVRLQKVLKKIKRKRDGDNLLGAFTQRQLEIRNQELQNMMRRIQICDQMIEVLDDYQYGDKIAMLMNGTTEVPLQ